MVVLGRFLDPFVSENTVFQLEVVHDSNRDLCMLVLGSNKGSKPWEWIESRSLAGAWHGPKKSNN